MKLGGGFQKLAHLWFETTDNKGCYKRVCTRCGFVSWIKRTKWNSQILGEI